VAKRLVTVRIEGLPDRLDRLNARVAQKLLDLSLDHLEALGDGLGVGGRLGCLQAHLEIIENGQQPLEQTLPGMADGVLLFAQDALARVVPVSLGAQEAVLEFGGLRGELERFLEQLVRDDNVGGRNRLLRLFRRIFF